MQAAWHDKLTLLLESTGDGMFGVDLDGRCTFINRAGAEILGYSTAQVLGQNMHDLIHHSHPDGSHYEEQQCPIFLAFRTGRPCRNDQEVFWRANGSRFNAEYSSHPVIDQGEVRGAVITFTDITQRKQTEEALARARLELEQRVAERTAELSQALLQLRQLSAHTEAVREQERKRIAREIHDELGSLLVALKFDVNWIARRVTDREPVADKCQTMNRLIERAVEDVGRIITDLRPSILDHQGLLAALEWQLQEFADATEIDCDTDIAAAPDAPAPEAQQATAVFRIFQEMLSNVARHAGATAVRIRIHLLPHELQMEVADNGVGVDASAPAARLSDQDSYGVMGMRERALHFGGALDIARGDDGVGTRVRLTMPLRSTA
ncbi:PAS domain-containing sensor histidine kinase [Duganella sp. sic0402]|uniref:sensor histidine kinase n=1 Tax=Duganella sp. sic0402 TaxID=2854786 RepID=UPI001C45A28A|nr:PAS domain-containing sensor histidine kinase [Duganella sp. sic0402]MBV7538193.1 PAS domain-containing sensor histidine kinase [Duganella sp. sic0402]